MIVGGGSRADIFGNRIGTTASGGAPLGNTGPGISIEGADGVQIGTPTSGGNTIAYNAKGVAVISGKSQRIRGNAIFGNTVLDIDLADDGPTANDTGDGDPGANNKQNFPVIASAVPAGGQNLAIAATLDSQPGTYDVDFYVGSACGAGSRGLSGGSTSIGATTVTITGGAKAFATTLAVPSPTKAGVVTATATGPDGSTSELSGCTSVQRPRPDRRQRRDRQRRRCVHHGQLLPPRGDQPSQQLPERRPDRVRDRRQQPADRARLDPSDRGQAGGGERLHTDGREHDTAGRDRRNRHRNARSDLTYSRRRIRREHPRGARVHGSVWAGDHSCRDRRDRPQELGRHRPGRSAANGNGTGIRVTGAGNTIQQNQIANSIDRGAADRNGTGVAVLAPDTDRHRRTASTTTRGSASISATTGG